MSVESTKTALITGASGGIGRALAIDLARDHHLVLVARDEPHLRQLAAEITSLGHGNSVQVIEKDLASPDAPRQLFDSLGERQIRVDLLVNNAGVGIHGRFADTDAEQELAMIRLNVEAPTLLTKLFLRPMLERSEGHVINLASLAAYQPGGPGMAVYFATKSYVLSFTKGLAVELRGSGVHATAICPGPVASGFARTAGAEKTRLYRLPTTAPNRIARALRCALRFPRASVIPGWLPKLMAFGGELPPRRIALEINRLLLRESR